MRFLQSRIDALAHRIHTVLTDIGLQFGALPSRKNGQRSDGPFAPRSFNQVHVANGIEQRTTKPNHPWINSPI